MTSHKKNFIYNLILTISQVVFPLISFPYVARIIQPEGVGLISLVDTITSYIILIAALGIPIYGVREVAILKKDPNKLSAFIIEVLIIHLILTLTALLIYFSVIPLLDVLDLNKSLIFLGAFSIFSNVFSIEWYYKGIEDFKFITIRSLIVRFLATLLIFYFVKEKNDISLYYSILVISTVCSAVINFSYAFNKINLKLNRKIIFLKKHIKPLFYIFSSIAFVSIYTLFDTVFLGSISGEKAVGIYSTGLKIARIPMLFMGTLSTVFLPKLSEHFRNNEIETYNGILNKSLNFVISFGIPLIFLITAISNKIVLIFAGELFVESAVILNILSPLCLIVGLSSLFGLQILTPMSKDKYLTYAVFAGMVSSLGLNSVLIPMYSEIGAAISNILSEIIVLYFTYFFSRKFVQIKIDISFVLKTFFYSIPMFLIPRLIFSFDISLIVSLFLVSIISIIYFLFFQIFAIKNQLVIEILSNFKKY